MNDEASYVCDPSTCRRDRAKNTSKIARCAAVRTSSTSKLTEMATCEPRTSLTHLGKGIIRHCLRFSLGLPSASVRFRNRALPSVPHSWHEQKRSSAPSEMLMMDFPEPLYETTYMQSRRMCLVCARKHAESVLRTTEKEIVPLCKDCAADWNAYGYSILKRIKPFRLIRRTLVFKILHLFQQPSLRIIWQDIQALQLWAEKMKKWM